MMSILQRKNRKTCKIQVSSVEKLLGVTISNTLCWDAHIEHLIKSVILIYSYCRA